MPSFDRAAHVWCAEIHSLPEGTVDAVTIKPQVTARPSVAGNRVGWVASTPPRIRPEFAFPLCMAFSPPNRGQSPTRPSCRRASGVSWSLSEQFPCLALILLALPVVPSGADNPAAASEPISIRSLRIVRGGYKIAPDKTISKIDLPDLY